MSTEGGTKAILAALGANLGLGVTKFAAWALTGSSSMLAEGIHSVADSGNQILLLIGGRAARKQATPEHPFGYARNRYFYAFMVAIVLFLLGGLFSLYEAYHKFQHPEPIESWQWVPIAVLLVGIGLEGFSLRTAIKESLPVKGKQSWARFIRNSRSPELPVILLEDTAALLGLLFALFGVSMTIITHNGIWDAIGTAMIGVLLVIVAVILVRETKSMLMGEAVTPENLARIKTAIADSSLGDLIHLRTMHLGPDDVLVAAKVGVEADASAADVAERIDGAERLIRDAVPAARLIFIEPDVYRASVTNDAADSPPHGDDDAPLSTEH